MIDRCHPKFFFPQEWHITHSPNRCLTECTMLHYIDVIILPYIEKVREDVGVDYQKVGVLVRPPQYFIEVFGYSRIHLLSMRDCH